VLGDRDGVDVADNGKRYAARVEGWQIDGVVADAVSRDDLQPLRLRDGAGRKRLGADDQCVRLADQRCLARLGNLLDVVVGDALRRIEERRPVGMKLAGDEDVRHQ
jgi:hypothetical protein